MIVLILGFWGLLAFAVFITIVMLVWSWCMAFVIIYTGSHEDAKTFIKITKDLFKP